MGLLPQLLNHTLTLESYSYSKVPGFTLNGGPEGFREIITYILS